MLRLCSRLVNTVATHDVMPCVSGLNIGVVIVNNFGLSNFNDEVIESKCPLRISVHTLNENVA